MIKLCKDCIHIHENYYCKINTYENIDYVTGKTDIFYDTCQSARKATSFIKYPCGPNAKYFQSKETTNNV